MKEEMRAGFARTEAGFAETRALFTQVGEFINRLAHVAEAHEQRLDENDEHLDKLGGE